MSLTIQLLKCANKDCRTALTEFELNKIKKSKRAAPKYYLCQKCRRSFNKIDRVHCIGCNHLMDFNGRRIKCDECIESMRYNYVRKTKNVEYRKREESKQLIMQLLNSNHSVNQGMFISFLEKEWNTIRKMITELKNSGIQINQNIKLQEYSI